MSAPLVSVVMPAYNAEPYIAEAIESILAQTLEDFEFIVVDDGSTDATAEIAARYAERDSRIVLLRNERNLNLPASINRGICSARGRYVARMDADDWSYPQRLERQVALMEANPVVVISGGAMEICGPSLTPIDRREYNLTDVTVRARIFRYSPFSHPAVIFRTEAARAVGGYDDGLFAAEDYDFYFRIGRHGEFANLPGVVLKLRTHPRSLSRSLSTRQERLTLYIRLKAVVEYGYRMSAYDWLYFFAQAAGSYLLPARLKWWLFNAIRRRAGTA